MNYTYMLQCSDGTYYTGWTNDIAKRLKTHNEGKGAKYTEPDLPVTLAYYRKRLRRKKKPCAGSGRSSSCHGKKKKTNILKISGYYHKRYC